ncbi:MAG: hypothetical protein ACTS3R_07810 [Inquilinaceae bacterium]
MPYASPIQTNFTSGELSPRLRGRVDIDRYFNGAATMENMVVLPHGGAARRPGTYFIAKVKDPAKFVRLIPFEYTTAQAYVLEFGDQYIRFFANHASLIDGGPPYEIVSPYQEADLDDIKFTQSADALYIVHPDWAPRVLSRLGPINWTLTVLDFIDGPYLDVNTGPTTLTPSATSGSVTVTASGIAGINDGAGFQAGDSGRVIRIDNPASGVDWGWGVITAVSSTTQVTVQVREAFATTGATGKWRLGAWSETTGWPTTVTFIEERLGLGNTDHQPQNFWLSRTNKPDTFSPSDFDGTVNADNAIAYEIADDRVNAIRWMSAGDSLVIGSAGAEFVVNSGNRAEPLTPTNILVKRQTTWGSSPVVPPTRIGHQVIFLQRAGRKLREFAFDFDTNGFVSPDITILSEHITRGQVFDMAYQQEPDSVLWASRGDGVLIGLTYQREQQVTGWHRHILGGVFEGGNPVVESIAAIPTPDDTANELWLCVVRTINGQQVRTIEYLTQPFDGNVRDQKDAYFVDCGLSYEGQPASAFAGLDHLEGETVSVLADGAVHRDLTVVGGEVRLDRLARTVHIGLPYLSELTDLPVEAGGVAGTAQGKIKRVTRIFARFFETLGALYGAAGAPLDRLPFRDGEAPMDSPPPLFTGDKPILFPGGYDRAGQVTFRQDQPLPMTVLAVVKTLQTNE